MKKLIILIVLVFFSALCFAETEIKVSKGLYDKDVYSIEYVLRPDNIVLEYPEYFKYGPSKYEFDRGAFEVFIPKEKFPISAPNCKKYIILRMLRVHALDPDIEQFPEEGKVVFNRRFIAEKKVVFDRIKEIKETGEGELKIDVNLSPYVKVIQEEPLELELTYCNVYFK